MLVDILNTYSNRLGMDWEFSAVNSSSEDYFDATAPDIDFNDVRAKILSDKVLCKRIVNQTIASLEFRDTLWDADGNKLNISVILSTGGMGFGMRAKVLVRTVDAVISGGVKSFLSVEAYRNYISNKLVEV